jgi:D-alanine-D-alanine ligase-like ATP-grasp enzyme
LRPAGELVLERLALAGRAGEGVPRAVQACLAFQGLALDAIPPRDATPFMDFRYGRRYAAQPARLASDDALPALPAAVRAQVDAFGARAAELRRQELTAPVLFAADAMLDEEGRLWWLELNANPAVPPEAYPPMLADLFGFEPAAGPPASAAAAAATA